MNKLFKRFLPFLFSLLLAASCFVVSVTATDEAVIAVEDAVAKAGDTAEIAITVNNNPGIAGMTLDVLFDSSVLTLTAVQDGGILGTNTHKPELTFPYTLSWSNDTVTENLTANGTIATLRFTVNENAAAGDYPVKLSYDFENYDIYNVDVEPVLFKTVNGCVTVQGSEEPTKEPTAAPTEPAAEPAAGTISVQHAAADAGKTAEIAVSVDNNPGIAGMTLDVLFDSSILTLTSVQDGGILGVNTHKPELTSPYTLSWSNDTAIENYTANGVIATLVFSVNEDAALGDYPITLSYDYDNYDIYNVDEEPVFFNTVNGGVTVNNAAPTEPSEERILGDADGDGDITSVDVTCIQRAVAHLDTGIDEDVLMNADVDGSGSLEITDATYI
ncbi:MAG: hypothetical protein IJH07_05630 [Ruminococcus sp.]|nr:hypothetical protein [Ruminococcus sp.]